MDLPEKNRRLFVANMAFLRARYPDLHVRVSGAAAGVFSSGDLLQGLPSAGGSSSGGSSGGGLVVETGRDGEHTLRKNNLYLESRFEPAKRAAAILRDMHAAGAARAGESAADTAGTRGEGTTVIFLGCGLGYHINAFLRRERGPFEGASGVHGGIETDRHILVEREVAVFSAALAVLRTDLLPLLLPLVGLDETEVLGRLGDLAHSRIALIRHPGAVQLHARYYAGVENGALGLLRETIASSTTERANSRLWVKNILKNVRALRGRCRPTSRFADAFSGPVILAASGPRLEDAAEALRGLKGSIPVIALLPSYPFLHAEGIEPDLLVTTDAGFWNRLRLVRGVRIPMLSTWSAEPVLLRSWAGELALFSHALPLEEGLRRLYASCLVVPMQGTASAVMIRLARAMGFGEIYLAGFDFAYRGMKDHHKGAGFDGVLLSSSNRFDSWHTQAASRFRLEPFISVRDQTGEETRTSRKLLLYRDWIEKRLAGGDLVRVTGGAAIRGVRFLSGGPADMSNEASVELRTAGHGERFRAALRGLMGGNVPAGEIEAEMAAVREGLARTGDSRSAYRFFFGAPPAGVPESVIRRDAEWALGELGKRWNLFRDD